MSTQVNVGIASADSEDAKNFIKELKKYIPGLRWRSGMGNKFEDSNKLIFYGYKNLLQIPFTDARISLVYNREENNSLIFVHDANYMKTAEKLCGIIKDGKLGIMPIPGIEKLYA